MKHRYLEVEAGISVNPENGKIEKEQPFYMASRIIYRAAKGDRIVVNDWAFQLAAATYNMEIPEEYMYTYMYEEEQNWSHYNGNLKEAVFSTEDFVFTEDCYFRIILKKEDGNWCIPEDAARINEILSFHSCISLEERNGDGRPKLCFEQEIRKTADTVLEKAAEGKALVFGLLTDSHYVVNGTWEDTVANLAAVNERVGFDGIIHLGDLQDGMLDKRFCRRIAAKCISDLRNICKPLYFAIGNHDTNYFKGNVDWLTEKEQYGIYGRFLDSYVCREGQKGWYYADYPEHGLRMIFLTSFNHRESLRYGFPEEEIFWVKKVLKETPEGVEILLFSHDAPLAELDYWASDIRNGEKLMTVLEEYHKEPGHCILGYIHGHTHADYVYRKRSFPIISVGCSKCEYFPDKKPENSIRYERKLNTVTQDLWDVLIVLPEQRRLEFVRFGAGEDRRVSLGTKVWAHRGASGYAPENTLEAFALAAEMGADGVELDVQLTKDGELVVAHDERIDRVSDGSGRIVDYTLAELKQFQFKKTHPEYEGECRIPTLREVFELLKDTGLTVNIELKTGIIFYEGIEEKTVALVHEMGYENRVLYSSFNHCSVLKVRDYDPEARLAFLYSHQLSNAADYALLNGIHAVNPSVLCTHMEDEMRQCRRKNVDVHVWTVNSEDEMRRLARMGVEAVITNYPDVAKRICEAEKGE